MNPSFSKKNWTSIKPYYKHWIPQHIRPDEWDDWILIKETPLHEKIKQLWIFSLFWIIDHILTLAKMMSLHLSKRCLIHIFKRSKSFLIATVLWKYRGKSQWLSKHFHSNLVLSSFWYIQIETIIRIIKKKFWNILWVIKKYTETTDRTNQKHVEAWFN